MRQAEGYIIMSRFKNTETKSEAAQSTTERLKGWTKAGAVIALGVSAAGALVACSPASGDELKPGTSVSETTPSSNTETTSPAVETDAQKEAAAEAKFEALVATFGASADKYTDPVAVVNKSNVDYQNLLNAGVDDVYMSSSDKDGFVATIQAKYDQAILPKMFTNSASGQELSSNIEGSLRTEVIHAKFATLGIEDPARFYKFSMDIVGIPEITPVDATTFIADVVTHETDNGKLNIGPNQIANGMPAQTDIMRYDHIVYKLVNGVWLKDSDIFNKPMENNSK